MKQLIRIVDNEHRVQAGVIEKIIDPDYNFKSYPVQEVVELGNNNYKLTFSDDVISQSENEFTHLAVFDVLDSNNTAIAKGRIQSSLGPSINLITDKPIPSSVSIRFHKPKLNSLKLKDGLYQIKITTEYQNHASIYVMFKKYIDNNTLLDTASEDAFSIYISDKELTQENISSVREICKVAQPTYYDYNMLTKYMIFGDNFIASNNFFILSVYGNCIYSQEKSDYIQIFGSSESNRTLNLDLFTFGRLSYAESEAFKQNNYIHSMPIKIADFAFTIHQGYSNYETERIFNVHDLYTSNYNYDFLRCSNKRLVRISKQVYVDIG